VLSVAAKILVSCLVVAAVGVTAKVAMTPRIPPAISLFNGHDLTGWDVEPGFWTVKDGAISGTGLPKVDPTFCVWRGSQPENFDLSVEYRLTAGNSGIGFRDDESAPHRLSGFQADLNGDGSVQGNLFDQDRLGLIAACGEHAVIGKDGVITVVGHFGTREHLLAGTTPGTWSTCHIIAKGNHVVEMINGVVTSEFTDHRPHQAHKGWIGLEMFAQHPGFDAQFRNIQLRVLPDSK
jgi:hypothetical protein